MSASNRAVAEWQSFWFLPIAAALGYSTSVLHVYSIGPFIAPLQQEFSWSRAEVSAGISVAAFGSAVFCIPVGMLIDRIGARWVALVGVLLMTAAVALLSTATGEMSNWLLLWGIVAIGTLGVQATVWTSAVTSRFEASRGLALAITLSGAAITATASPILATWLIGAHGWRTAFAGMAGIWVLIVFPVLLLYFRGARDAGGPATGVAARALTGLSLSEGLRSPTLYKLLTAAGLFTFTAIGVIVHLVPILKDSGATPLAAAGIASLVGIFSVIGRLGTGMLLDRYAAHKVGALAFLLPIIGSALLLLDGANPLSQSVAAAIFGLTLGSEVDVVAYLAAKHFGLRNFGALYGSLVMALALGAGFGPLAAGAVFDRYAGYAPFLLLSIGLMAVSAIALLSIRPPLPSTSGAEARVSG